MKKFKVWASSTELFVLEIEAENENEAWKIAQDADGSDFESVKYSGDWQLDNIEEIK
jgi:hypothetical protein